VSVAAILFFGLLAVALVRSLGLWFLSLSYRRRPARAGALEQKITVVVPALNEESSIAGCIDSLLRSKYGNFDAVVVDDGSTDKTLEIAKRFEGPAIKIIHQENRGKAEAMNAGILASDGSIILTVDADTRLHPDALGGLAERFSSKGKLGALAGNVKVDNARGLLQRLQELEYTASIGLIRKGQSVLGSVMIVPGPIAAIRREAWERAGRFSNETFAEDFDITLGILKAGYTVEYEDSAIAYTVTPRTVEDLLKQRRRWYRGMIQVLAKHQDMVLTAKNRVARIIGIPYMWFDTMAAMINLFLSAFAVIAGYITGDWTAILFGLSAYWVLQTVMAICAISMDKERKASQILLSPLLVIYNTFLDGVRTAAFVEEMLTLRMKWETPRR
jgi:cellulose synthase/poly-beta-1,6-N-acetylglucosamine synthase-like glycosyltransferase